MSKGKGDCPYFVLIAVLACGILAANAFLAGRPVAPPEGGRPASGRLFLADDALISLRYSQRLLEGKGLTWTDGEKVEGYSNLLWTLSCAALGACGLDLILAARLLGFLGMAAAVSAIVFAFRPVRGPPESDRILPAAFGAFALALSTPIAVWTIGGLEQPLLLGLLAWAVVLSYPSLDGERVGARRLLTIGFLLAGVVLTRPEGALLAVLVCLAVAASRGKDGQPVRSLLILAALPAAAYLGQLAFRMAYYGEWLPNTAQVKLGLSRERLREGSVYVARGAAAVWPLLLAAAVALVAAARDRYRRGRTGLLAAIALAWLVYIVLVGGDVFPAWRQLVVVILCAALLAAGAFEWLLARAPQRRAYVWLAAAAVLAALGLVQAGNAGNVRARTSGWVWDGEVVGRMLKAAFGERRPLLAVDTAGSLPYWSGLPSLDMLGLSDKHIAHHRPATKDAQNYPLFHELGDGKYVLDRGPDLLIFTRPHGPLPLFRSGREILQDPRFFRQYQPVSFEGRDPYVFRSLIWVKREGGPIGIQRTDATVTVPAYFLCPERQLKVQVRPGLPEVSVGEGSLDATGNIGTVVREGAASRLPPVRLPPGRWRVATLPAVPGVLLAARLALASGPAAPAAEECAIEVPPDSDGGVVVTVERLGVPAAHVRALVFEKEK